MNKTHEELADEAARAIHGGIHIQNRRSLRIILTAITAAVQAEREQSRAVLDAIVQCESPRDMYDTAIDELARLSLNDSRSALSNDA